MAPPPQPSSRPRPGSTKPIVPAIPLPYMQKRKQQTVVPKQAEQKSKEADTIPTTSSSARSVSDHVPASANRATDLDLSTDSSQLLASNVPISPGDEGRKESTAEAQESSGPTSSEYDAGNTPPLATSDYHSSTSQSTHNIVTVPGPVNQERTLGGDAVRFPKHPSFGSHRPMHHTHPSAGSLVFGGYTDSNTSSPVPPHSGINMVQPPHGFPPDRRFESPPHVNGSPISSFPNGFIPMGPQGPQEFVPRQEGVTGQYYGAEGSLSPPEVFTPSGITSTGDTQRLPTSTGETQRLAQHEPSTSHSFQGSQSSAEKSPPARQQGHSNPPTGSQSIAIGPPAYTQTLTPAAQAAIPIDNLDGLVAYLQSQFAEPRYADYILELRYTDDRATPVQIPGHTVILARSPTLKNQIVAKARDSNHGQPVKTLLLESNDRFLRSDAFWLAVQRLYGGPLLDPGAPATISALTMSQVSSGTPGTPADRFDLALGYAAAGHLLQMPPVLSRGVDVASHFVHWSTVEKALDFSLDGGLGPQWMHLENRQSNAVFANTYGPIVDMLIHSALNFLISAFPPNFEFDASVSEPPFNRRIPFVPDIRVSNPNPRLSSIKFGDHSSEDVVASASVHPSVVLSKVLLNLPFHLLKYVLESPRLGNVQGWATQNLRINVLNAVVKEREKRRNRARDSKNISNSERTANFRAWEAVGWQESVTQFNAGDMPTLTRTWVDFVLPDLTTDRS